MKNSKDDLGTFFNDVFDAEPITFDPQAWAKMEALLNGRKRRRAMLWWFAGGAGALTVSLLTLLSLDQERHYIPRSDAHRDGSMWNKGIDLTNSPTSSLRGSANSETNVQAHSSPAIEATVLSYISSSKISKTAGVQPQQTTPPARVVKNDELAIHGGAQPVPESVATHISPMTEDPNRIENNRTGLQPMRILTFYPVTKDLPDGPEKEIIGQSNTWNPYLSIGLNHVLERGFAPLPIAQAGQWIALGMVVKVVPHFLLQPELLIARDRVDYRYTQMGERYGFGSQTFQRTAQVSEMILAELPLLGYYRNGRFKVGAGISIGTLLTTKVNEWEEWTNLGRMSTNEGEVKTTIGYVNWAQERRVLISLPIAFEFQAHEKYAIGARYKYGLTDAFSANSGFNRKNRISIYLSMHLQR